MKILHVGDEMVLNGTLQISCKIIGYVFVFQLGIFGWTKLWTIVTDLQCSYLRCAN